MLRILAGLLALILALAAAGLAAGVIEGVGTPRCDDQEAVLESDADECFEASSAGKATGLVLTGAGAVVALIGVYSGVAYFRRREAGSRLVLCAIGTLLLAGAALFLLSISF